MLERLKTRVTNAAKQVFCHRVIYAGLSATYVVACLHISDVLVYGAAALLYLTLSLRG